MIDQSDKKDYQGPLYAPWHKVVSGKQMNNLKMKHILFTLKGCDTFLLNDELIVKNLITNAAEICSSKLLAINSHKFEPQGVTCLAMLAESHISIHTWPEKGMAVCDVFTCGAHTEPEKAVEYMRLALEAKDIIVNEFVRPLE